MNLLDLDALALAAAIRSREVSPTEVVETSIEAARVVGPRVGAFTSLDEEAARQHAVNTTAALDAAHRVGDHGWLPPLLGVPCPIKDLTALAGSPLRAGSAATDDEPVIYDDGVVTLLKQAGTVPLGKTSAPEFGLPCYTEPDIGPPARTPWDLTRSAGGSSGGAAAAVAAGIVPAAHGSDGGGSIRIPASACGLVGLKPSRGVISPGPYGVDGPGLVSHGMLTRTVRDTAAFLDVLAHPEPGDTFSAPGRPPSYLTALDTPPRPLRIGLLTLPLVDPDAPVHPACTAAAVATAEMLATLGHEVTEIGRPFDAERWLPFSALWSVGALQVPVPADRERLLVPLTRWLRQVGRGVTGVAYAEALVGIQLLTREIAAAWSGLDVVVSPTLAQLPAPIGSQRNDEDPGADFAAQTRFTPWTSVWNLTGWPSISLPLGEAEVPADNGGVAQLPIGVMLGASLGQDATLLALAAQLEEAMPWSRRRAPVWAGSSPRHR